MQQQQQPLSITITTIPSITTITTHYGHHSITEWDGGVNDTTGSVSIITTHLTWSNNNKWIRNKYRSLNLAGKKEEKEKERKKEEDDDDNKYASRTSGSGAAVPFGPSVVTLLCDISRGPSGGGGGQMKVRWEYFQPSVPYFN